MIFRIIKIEIKKMLLVLILFGMNIHITSNIKLETKHLIFLG